MLAAMCQLVIESLEDGQPRGILRRRRCCHPFPRGLVAENYASPVLGQVDIHLAGGGPHMIALRSIQLFIAAGGGAHLPVHAGEIEAHFRAGRRGLAGAWLGGVAGDAAPGNGQLHAPSVVCIAGIIQRAAQVHCVFQPGDFPIVQNMRVIKAVGAGDE